jgi:class 3 adenylate cyclase/DNA-binding CsgD family transcriptional regulator
VWEESAFRTILFVDLVEAENLTRQLGDNGSIAVVKEYRRIIDQSFKARNGRLVKSNGQCLMGCFRSVVRAVECATQIQQAVREHNVASHSAAIHVRIGLSAGEPVTDHGELFGAVIQLTAKVCAEAEPDTILATSAVRDACVGKDFVFAKRRESSFWDVDEPILLYEVQWQAIPPQAPAAGHLAPAALAAKLDGLSIREAEVLRLIAAGKSNQAISDELVISLNTVLRHVSNIFAKTGATNRTEAGAYAHRNGMV